MRLCRSLLTLCALAAILSAIPISAQDKGVEIRELLGADTSIPTYHALVVGINDYDHWQDLRQAQPDAESLAGLLRERYGFSKVTLLPKKGETRVTREQILGEFERLTNDLTAKDAILIYYSGHGYYDKKLKVGYWVPSDARETIEGRLAKADWIWNSTLMQYVQAMEARHILIISDSCFSGALFKAGRIELSRKENTWYRRAIQNPSRWGIASGDLETVPDQSVFATKLLQLLRYPQESVFSSSDLAGWLKKEVAEHSGRQPVFGPLNDPKGLQSGEFVFLARKGKEVPGPTMTKPVVETVRPVVVVRERKAELVIQAEPPGAEVWVGGKQEGQAGRTLTIALGQLESKQVPFTLKLAGYQDFLGTVEVKAGKTARPEVIRLKKLDPEPPPPQRAEPKGLPPELLKIVEIPTEDKDRHGNPVRKGTEEDSGWPLEIRHKQTGMHLVFIPAGEFMMGSKLSPKEVLSKYGGKKGWKRFYTGEHPQHKVRLSRPFYLGKYEVTVGQFKAFVEAGKYRTEAETGDGAYGWSGGTWTKKKDFNWKNPGFQQTDDHPVVCVSWNDAQAFCRWAKLKLPTEAQWEYACRAGTTTTRFWGDEDKGAARYANVADEKAKRELNFKYWFKNEDDGYVYTAPAGRFLPNTWGLYDTIGNAWEWCQDWYAEDYYKNSPAADPGGAEKGSLRVLRGGSWYSIPRSVRAADRYWDSPGGRDGYSGFRGLLDF